MTRPGPSPLPGAARVPAPPSDLYGIDDLLGGWDPDDPASYTRTFDGRTYLEAVHAGLRTPHADDVAMRRALHDVAVTRLLQARLRPGDAEPVAIMGGHAASRDGHVYAASARLAAALTDAGATVITGGGPGAMEAAHLGALAGTAHVEDLLQNISADDDRTAFPDAAARLVVDGRWDADALVALHRWQEPAFRIRERFRAVAGGGIGIPTWLYGHEPPTPLASCHAKYFENSVREDGLLALAYHGAVYLPGSAGTLQEIFQDLAQNHYRTVQGLFSPMVFLDVDRHWSERFPVLPVIRALLRPQDADLVLCTEHIGEAVEFLAGFEPFG